MKRGEELPPKTCDNPVAHEYELGHLAGLTRYAGDRAGRWAHARGYVSADQLGEVLGI